MSVNLCVKIRGKAAVRVTVNYILVPSLRASVVPHCSCYSFYTCLSSVLSVLALSMRALVHLWTIHDVLLLLLPSPSSLLYRSHWKWLSLSETSCVR